MSVLRDHAWSHPIINPVADEMADTVKWQILFNNLKRFYEISNSTMATTINAEMQLFYKERTAAKPILFDRFEFSFRRFPSKQLCLALVVRKLLGKR
ncbi:hypothetical protein ACFFNY_26185 [Paenibacillus hodogayensis]|uniref:Uncharacterized protein n=1 Tax=Paenibacillus hodogayensis TaxID=279208 RepID=A0ABV5W3G3_9BACL